MKSKADVQDYYRRITDQDIGQIARILLGDRIVQETSRTLFCDCPNHKSQSHRSLQIELDKQLWHCFGCGLGGDILQLVEFVHHGTVTRGQSGKMPDSHRQARDWLAAQIGMEPLSKISSQSPEEEEKAEAEREFELRVYGALTALAEIYHQRLISNSEVLAWFRDKYRIGDEMIERLKIGYADDGPPSIVKLLTDGPEAFTESELIATSAFRLTYQDHVVPYFHNRIIFPYWSRGHVVYLIARKTPWTPTHEAEQAKYKKLAVHNDHNFKHVAKCIRNDVLYNEDILLTRPERVIITEGVTDCISLMEHGFPAISPATVQLRDADRERIVRKLSGVKTVYICQDNEFSEVGIEGALKTARLLSERGIKALVATLPLGEKQIAARAKLKAIPKDERKDEKLLADAKIDVNEFFASGKTAEDFEAVLAQAQLPIEASIARLDPDTPYDKIAGVIKPILEEIARLGPMVEDHYLRLIQDRYGKDKITLTTLRNELKFVKRGMGRGKGRGPGAAAMRRPARGGGDGNADGNGENSSDGSSDGSSKELALPEIQVNNRQLRAIVSDAWGAVNQANQYGCKLYPHTPFLFVRCGDLVRLVVGEFGPEIEEMNEAAMVGLLARTATWVRSTQQGDFDAPPPRDVARDMLAYPDEQLPILESVIRTPVFGRQGNLINTDGYHKDDRLWLTRDARLGALEIPEAPTAEQVAAARELLLNDLLVDFPFASESDRAHAVAALILPFVRRMIDGPTPLHLIEAPTMGSGKGLLANLISITATGSACEARTMPESEDEVRKMITAELMKGRPIILLDNANDNKQVSSPALASVLTSERWTDRKLGESAMVSAPNHAMWLMTGNNPSIHTELARRCIRIRIDPKVDQPWLRTEFKHPQIAIWAKDNRTALVTAVLTLIQAWIAAGKPAGKRHIGSFERWSSTIGGILEVAGVPGFLANLNELYDKADAEGRAWREFIAAWWSEYGETPKKVSELNQLCEQQELLLRLRGDGSTRSQQIRLGKALNGCLDRTYNGLIVVHLRKDSTHKGTSMYALHPATGGSGGDVWGCSGDVASKHPHELSAEKSAGSGQTGDVWGCFPNPSRVDGEKKHAQGEGEIFSHVYRRKGPETSPNIPNIPKSPVTDWNEKADNLGMFESNIPTVSATSPSLSDTNGAAGREVSLADLAEEYEGGDEPLDWPEQEYVKIVYEILDEPPDD